MIFHIGISYHYFLFQSTYNVLRFDDDSSPWKNQAGKSYKPWWIEAGMFVYMLLVPTIAFLLNKLFSILAAQIAFFSLGVIGIVFYRQGIDFVYRAFLKRRYTMMEGFRKSV
jgi:Family of unknown function (DUF5687)